MKDKLFELFETNGELHLETVALNISMAAVLGFLIFVSYYITHRGTIYSKKFNASLVVLTVLTGTVMTVIGNNIALSLGMVGALSIVRFRTAIKDSRDTVYIFWTVIVGICCGVGDYMVALIGSAITFIVLLILGAIKNDMELVKESNLYCRENALQALYSIGDTQSVINALKLLDRTGGFHHSKMIADGLLSFGGERELLDKKLWQSFNEFSLSLKLPVLDYFRFSSDAHKEKVLHIMNDKDENQELRFSAIRYFAKYHYEPALDCLYGFATDNSPIWEYKAIAATALGNYPSVKTEEILRDLLCDRNWYVRYNAADSLERLGVKYEEMIDVFEGGDRYASEMLRYRFDRKKLKEKEAVTV